MAPTVRSHRPSTAAGEFRNSHWRSLSAFLASFARHAAASSALRWSDALLYASVAASGAAASITCWWSSAVSRRAAACAAGLAVSMRPGPATSLPSL